MLLNKELTLSQKLDLKKSLHKNDKDEPDLTATYIKSREKWEIFLGLDKNASINAASDLLVLLIRSTNLIKKAL